MKHISIKGIISSLVLVVLSILLVVFIPKTDVNVGGENKTNSEIPKAFLVRVIHSEAKTEYIIYGVNGDYLCYKINSSNINYSIEDLYKDYESGELYKKADVYEKAVNTDVLEKNIKKYKKGLKGNLEIEDWSYDYSLCIEYNIKSDCIYGLAYDDNHNLQVIRINGDFNESGYYLNNDLINSVVMSMNGEIQFEKIDNPVLKDFEFNSVDDVLNLSNDDLVYLAKNNHKYDTGYFIKDFTGKDVEDFGIPLGSYDIGEYTYKEHYYKSIYTNMFSVDIPRSQMDLNQKYPDEEYDKLIEKYTQKEMELFDANKMKSKVKYCGETDNYVEYSYRIVTKKDEDGKIHCLYERIIFPRNIFNVTIVDGDEEEYLGMCYLGELTVDSVREVEDYIGANTSGNALYREIVESEDKIMYRALYPHVSSGGYYGKILEELVVYDKNTHQRDFWPIMH